MLVYVLDHLAEGQYSRSPSIIADGTGLGLRAVKYALTDLVPDHLIRVKRGAYRPIEICWDCGADEGTPAALTEGHLCPQRKKRLNEESDRKKARSLTRGRARSTEEALAPDVARIRHGAELHRLLAGSNVVPISKNTPPPDQSRNRSKPGG